MIGSLEYAKASGITDIVTVIDPIMDKVLRRSDNAPYDYIGQKVQMGKVPALAALLDCTDERIDRVRAFAGIHGDVFAGPEQAERLKDRAPVTTGKHSLMLSYLQEQLADAATHQDRIAARRMWRQLFDQGLVDCLPPEEDARAY
jgi:acyl homoserine lactone synthase